MVEPTRIVEVNERVRDFTAALRQAGADDIAKRIDGYAAGFVDGTQVRRSIDAIKQQLAYFRAAPHELPNLPIVLIAANRLEDVCKDALRAGMIAPARPSLRAVAKRKLSVVTTTLTAAAVMLLLPLLLIVLGIDINDLPGRRALPPMRLFQGDELTAQVNVLVESAEPAATSGVEFYVLGHCARDLPEGASCRALGPRAIGGETLESYEVLLDGQAYGLIVAFAEARVLGAVGSGRVLIAANSDTPIGHYELPLQAAFIGYAPERCSLWARLQKHCESAQRGPSARHPDLPVPTLVIEVQRALPGQRTEHDRDRERAEAAERKRAAERAHQIKGAMSEIKTALDDTETTMRRKRYDEARERLEKLAALFAPLDALTESGDEAELPPAEVNRLRARFEAERSELGAFRDRAFEAAYAALNRPRDPSQSDDIVLTDTARKLGITPAFLEAIYAEHGDQIEQRLARQEEAKKAAQRTAAEAVERRCGPLPTGAWREVQSYLAGLARTSRVKTHLDECFTPRLDETHCWSVVCKFDEIVEEPERLTDTITHRTWTFSLQHQRVSGHVERVVDGT
ncbi:MAG TPA: hypothetical protein VHZ95_02425 [Polyangiales bacterium]|nr:hypothetical protein [Polyangiales bacterium]